MTTFTDWPRPHVLGLGTGELRDLETCRRTVARALDLGYRHVDTASLYGNESAIGEALRESVVDRDGVFLATKVPSENLGRDDLRDSVAASRDALDVETIDLVYVHWPAHAYDPEETLGALSSLRDRGTIRHIGLSNFTPALLDGAVRSADPQIFAIQAELHPFLPQRELRERARRHGIRVVAHTPLCQGQVVDHTVLSSIAKKHGVTEAQVSLAWILSMDGVAAVPGARGEHIEENLDAVSLALDADDVRRIEAIEERRRCVSYDFAPWADEDRSE